MNILLNIPANRHTRPLMIPLFLFASYIVIYEKTFYSALVLSVSLLFKFLKKNE